MNRDDVSVIIPSCNEAETIGEVIARIRSLYPRFEVIVVDDGSKDDTGRAAKDAGAIVYTHPYNIGNGAAIKSGIRIASGRILVFMDGDGQHDPADIGELLNFFPQFDMVVGAREGWSGSKWGRALGNRIYNRLASYVSKFRVEDLTSGFRAIKSEIARNFLYLLPNSYSYPTTLTLCTLRSGRSVKYVPIRVRGRKAGRSRIRIHNDGFRFLLIIIKICTLYSPLRVFLPISLFMFFIGLSYYLYTLFAQGRFTNMSGLLFTTSVLIFMMGLISEQICQMRFEKSEGDKLV